MPRLPRFNDIAYTFLLHRVGQDPVSYTHLDVYKRQACTLLGSRRIDQGLVDDRQDIRRHKLAENMLGREMCIRDSRYAVRWQRGLPG